MGVSVNALARAIGYWCASVAVVPALVSFRVRSPVLGRNRALEGSTQALSLVPGVLGQYVRRAFLCRVLAHCARSSVVEFGTIFSKAAARLDENVYVGPRCHLGFVHIERDALLGPGVHVTSGPRTHGIADASLPIREQSGEPRMVRIGAGAWIGSAAIVMADVGRGTVVGAGAVVTRDLPGGVVAAGVPARIISTRGALAATAAGGRR